MSNSACPKCGAERSNQYIFPDGSGHIDWECGVRSHFGIDGVGQGDDGDELDCLRNQLATQTSRAIKYMKSVEQHDLEWSEKLAASMAEAERLKFGWNKANDGVKAQFTRAEAAEDERDTIKAVLAEVKDVNLSYMTPPEGVSSDFALVRVEDMDKLHSLLSPTPEALAVVYETINADGELVVNIRMPQRSLNANRDAVIVVLPRNGGE